MKEVSLKGSVAALEDAIIVISGPALAISGIIAGVDLVTGGNILKNMPGFTLAWAITLLLTLDFQVLCLGVRAHRVYVSNKKMGRKITEIMLAVLIAAAISYVSIQMQSIIARVNAENITLDLAAYQLGINMVWLIWERSTLVLVLIFMAGWLREHDTTREQTQPIPSISDEHMHIILSKLAKLDDLEQRMVLTLEQVTQPQLPAVSSHHLGTALPAQENNEASSQEAGTDEARVRMEVAYARVLQYGIEVSASQLAQEAHVRKATAIEWLRNHEQKE